MSKYKFTLAPKIKGIVEWQLEHYQEDKRMLQDEKENITPSGVASYSPTGGISGSYTHRNTEDVAIRIVTNPYIRQLEQSTAAIDHVLSKCTPVDLQLIDLVYWKQAYTPEGAGMKIGLSKSATYQHINNFLGAIALEMGYVNI